MEKLMLFTILFLAMLESGHCQCSKARSGYQRNIETLLDLLSKNAPLHDGFYEASVGNNSADQVFGILHCKAHISRTDCTNCFRYPLVVYDECPSGMETLSTTCTMKFSNKNFFGIWSNSSLVSTFENNGLDDPLVFSNGLSMMQDLASRVPDQPLMYLTAEIDAGVDGKRYGLALCGRDLSKSSCQDCLEDRLVESRSSYPRNRTGWEIIGVGCSLWYSNVSFGYTPGRTSLTPSSQSQGTPTYTSGVQRCQGGIGIATIYIISLGINIFTPFVLICDLIIYRW